MPHPESGAASVAIVNLLDRGPLSWGQGLAIQQEIHGRRVAGEGQDSIIFLEHAPLISIGKRGEAGDVLASPALLAQRGVEIQRSDRGGQVTWHGPGQLVVYFVVDLGRNVRQVRSFVEGIEGVVMDYLQDRYGLTAHLEPGHPGIWLEQGKVAAVGISLHQRVSMHGLALNLAVDPAWFAMIVPCGIRDRPAVSVADCGVVPDTLAQAAQALGEPLARMIRRISG